MQGNDGAKWPGREKTESGDTAGRRKKGWFPKEPPFFFKRSFDPYLPANSITWAVKGLANRMIMATTKT